MANNWWIGIEISDNGSELLLRRKVERPSQETYLQ